MSTAPDPRRPREKTLLLPQRSQVSFQRVKLVCINGPGQGSEHELEQESLTIGSADDCDLRAVHNTVSRKHFSITRDGPGWLLRDLDSTNGTYVDDLRVKEVFLRPGARIGAGSVTFRFELATCAAELEPSEREQFGRVLGKSVAMRQIFAALEKVAPTDATVLLVGDTGSGKGAMARAIHDASSRAGGPFVVFDCGAVAPGLIESELFGHERGAFTGAVKQRAGALEEAQGGTLFIDELAELPLGLQPKLLRALEEREITRVGASRSQKIDCRVVAATQHDLWEEVNEGRFRRDLYFRLAVVTIQLPLLADRREDISLLADRFLAELGHAGIRTFEEIPPALRRRLLGYDWPGNVRELRNALERICLGSGVGVPNWEERFQIGPGEAAPCASSPDGELTVSVSGDLPFKDAKQALVDAFEKEYVQRLVARAGNNIALAARQAGIGRRHLYSLLAKHGLDGAK